MWKQILIEISQILFTVLAPVVAAAVAAACFKIAQHFHVSISAREEQAFQNLLQQGIAFAEEKSAAGIKAGGVALTPQQKLAEATHFINEATNAAAPNITNQIIAALPSSWRSGATAPAQAPAPAAKP